MSTNASNPNLLGIGSGQPSTVADNRPSIFTPSTMRPFLKGSVPNSIFVDITTVTDKKLFLTELTSFCNGDEHLWAVADQIRRDYHKLYAELTVSPDMYAQLCSDGLQLPSFVDRFHVFPSLSPSATLLKVTLAGLPHQYGRREGGLAQLHDDMQRNLSSFGTVVDSGIIKGSSGVYSGKGYVVLEQFLKTTDNTVEHRLPELQHNVRWVYQPLDYSSQPRPSSLLAEVDINVHATWSSMKPYCRYCHGDHSLNNCEVRQKAIICYWCNGSGHIAKYCDRKNVYGASGVPNKKSRKIPANSEDVFSMNDIPATVTSSAEPFTGTVGMIGEVLKPSTDVDTVVSDPTTSLPTSQPLGTAHSKYARVLRSASSQSSPANDTEVPTSAPSKRLKICPHCGREGHLRKQHHECAFYVPKMKALDVDDQRSNEDADMDDIVADGQEVFHTDHLDAPPAGVDPQTSL
ncbi:hypothetical protein G6F68_008820 [Rhizopus microsporus]|nr:hypothetical protein G6F68_008820 [Rhizopus microsporus]